MQRRCNNLMVHGNTLTSLLFVSLVVSGCRGLPDIGDARAHAPTCDSRHESYAKARDVNSADPTTKCQFKLQAQSGEPMPRFLDRVLGRCPADLLTAAHKVLGEDIIQVWRQQGPWAPTKKVYTVVTQSGEEGIFLEKDGRYVHVNSRAELLAINELVGEFKFTRPDFSDPDKVDSLLSMVAGLHQGPHCSPGSSVMLRMTIGRDFEWLRGTEDDGGVLHELAEDPEFTFNGDTWSVVFNLFKVDGAVDRWKVVGEHDPKAEKNQILNIEVTPLKPPGTFSWPFMG